MQPTRLTLTIAALMSLAAALGWSAVSQPADAQTPTATPTLVPPVATPTTAATPTSVLPPPADTATPVPATPVPGASACADITGRVPSSVVSAILANPRSVGGFEQPRNPNVPASALNPPRRFLSLSNPNVPYHPIFNRLVWVAGCP